MRLLLISLIAWSYWLKLAMEKFWIQQYSGFLTSLNEEFKENIKKKIEKAFYEKPHGKIDEWKVAINKKQGFDTTFISLKDSVTVKTNQNYSEKELFPYLKIFKPWRKGPFKIDNIEIDTEWRSDWKWERIKNKISPLTGKTVLDVGCGNGYYCFRMKGAGAKQVVGIEPMISYVAQFFWLNKFFKQDNISVLPFTLEQWTNDEYIFDTIFSMGVFYHRRSPIDHLLELRQCLNTDGQLVLETLIIDGENDSVLVPKGRYAKMRNIWFIPTISHLKNWLKRTGFKDIKLIDVNKTGIAEQRSTKWMEFESLVDFLDTDDLNKTIEGYPAPLRATLVATKVAS